MFYVKLIRSTANMDYMWFTCRLKYCLWVSIHQGVCVYFNRVNCSRSHHVDGTRLCEISRSVFVGTKHGEVTMDVRLAVCLPYRVVTMDVRLAMCLPYRVVTMDVRLAVCLPYRARRPLWPCPTRSCPRLSLGQPPIWDSPPNTAGGGKGSSEPLRTLTR